MTNIQSIIQDSINIKKTLLQDEYIADIHSIARCLIGALRQGNMIFMAGNGGSAADAQHFAAELAGKFESERSGLPAIALTTNVSNITAIANDYSYDVIFSRQIQGLGREKDVFFGISTSGNSKNILEAAKTAREKNMITLGLLGCDGGKIKNLCDMSIIIPSKNTARIQESHIMIIHIISKLIDEAFAKTI